MRQAFQVLGSLLILASFAGAQRRVLSTESRVYLMLNLVGSTILGVEAAVPHFQAGFFLLEGSWALISAWGLLKTRPKRA